MIVCLAEGIPMRKRTRGDKIVGSYGREHYAWKASGSILGILLITEVGWECTLHFCNTGSVHTPKKVPGPRISVIEKNIS